MSKIKLRASVAGELHASGARNALRTALTMVSRQPPAGAVEMILHQLGPDEGEVPQTLLGRVVPHVSPEELWLAHRSADLMIMLATVYTTDGKAREILDAIEYRELMRSLTRRALGRKDEAALWRALQILPIVEQHEQYECWRHQSPDNPGVQLVEDALIRAVATVPARYDFDDLDDMAERVFELAEKLAQRAGNSIKH